MELKILLAFSSWSCLLLWMHSWTDMDKGVDIEMKIEWREISMYDMKGKMG